MGRAPSLFYCVVILLVATFFRFHLLSADVRFHVDEAFFASFARNAAVRGEWLLPGNLDKTPLSIYGQAVTMLLFGIRWDGAVWRLDAQQGEFAARMFSAYASVLLVAVTYRVATVFALTLNPSARVGGRAFARPYTAKGRDGLLAAALVALSPYGIAFGATAFTDTPMVLFAMLAAWMALRGRGAWAGLWLVLAYATKQQAVLFAPLIMGVWVPSLLAERGFRGEVKRVRAFTLTVTLGLAALTLWDAARPFSSVLLLAAQNNAPGGLFAAPGDVLPRLAAWLRLSAWMFGGALITFPLLGLALWHMRRSWWLLFVIGYGLLHWLVPLNIYDRYLLPLVPLWAVLIAVSLANRLPRAAWMLVLLAMLPAAWSAANARLPIGGDKDEHAGIIELADDLNGREFGAIVYDRWLGWHLNYYLGAWSDKRRAYYPTPQQMTADPALTVPDVAPRYFPVPNTANVAPWLAALERAGFAHCVGYSSENFTVYVLALTPAADGETSAFALARAACR